MVYIITGSLFVAFLWALVTIIHVHVLHTLQSHTIILISSIATVLFAGIYCLYHKESIIDDFKNINAKLIFWICVTTFISVITANILYLELLKHHNTAVVTALTYSAPIIVLILSMILFKETISVYSCIGIFLVICGTILVGISHNSK